MTIDYSGVRHVDIQNATIYESEYVNESQIQDINISGVRA